MNTGCIRREATHRCGCPKVKMIEKIKENLLRLMDEFQYNHIIGTLEIALHLAKRHNLEEKKVCLAALLHDYAKIFSQEEMVAYIAAHKISLDKIEEKIPSIWHGLIGSYMAKEEFGIDDQEILKAIKIHSTADEGMSVLDKVIYVADYIEPRGEVRSYNRREILLLAEDDLDEATLKAIDLSLEHLIKERKLIHPRSIKARNELIGEGVKRI